MRERCRCWLTAQVRDFVRIPLADVLEIQRGAYILSTLSSFARDPRENQGTILRYRTTNAQSRARVYSVNNRAAVPDEPSADVGEASFAFKIMRADLVKQADVRKTTAEQDVRALVDRLAQAVEDAGAGHDGLVKDADIVSLADAQKRTTYRDRLAHTLAHAVWL